MSEALASPRRLHRPRGVYVPADDVPLHLANGWKLMDDCPGGRDVLLAPPPTERKDAP